MFNKDTRYSNQITTAIEPTDNSFALIASAVRAAKSMWRPGFQYLKADIVLIGLTTPQDLPVPYMFATRDLEKSKPIMEALDAVNASFGRDTRLGRS